MPQKFIYRPPTGVPPLVYQDDHLLAVDKPTGLLSNPGRAPETHDCALSRLTDAYGELWLIHRLDCDTSGLLLLARTKQAERELKKQLQARQIQKTYEAIAQGELKQDTGEIREPLGPQTDNPPFQQVSANGKTALTRYRVLARANGNTRLALYPHTGRTHQLRVHMAWLGHPLLGDAFYGRAESYTRLCLHARALQLNHPTDMTPLSLETDCPF
ncbi:RluA family pseudouridine synthase [Simiduia agarivorans]|uniref:Pseudouridine synthase n=1 Tax=Simiduia agarivorans (strain DSM 21679 / JCM 13881 / BCRC 17597 / SA1) TaxID=1117647 RepID=K4KG94_SIMAS|nr:RluA family pseudouridine synthase [Simiduia agarivorans]AFU97996.1 pseudouridine synthase [Simiduia agarivorans SA1 = DSM 21679]